VEIISLSLDQKTLDKIQDIKEKASFNGRSQLFRTAIENLHQQIKQNQSLEGEINAVIIVRHPHTEEQSIAHISHRYDDIITTQLHSKLDGENCLEVFHTQGKAQKLIQFYNKLEGSKNTESVNILPQS
jgi:CopG family nickel-responsive transcriptional regulator